MDPVLAPNLRPRKASLLPLQLASGPSLTSAATSRALQRGSLHPLRGRIGVPAKERALLRRLGLTSQRGRLPPSLPLESSRAPSRSVLQISTVFARLLQASPGPQLGASKTSSLRRARISARRSPSAPATPRHPKARLPQTRLPDRRPTSLRLHAPRSCLRMRAVRRRPTSPCRLALSTKTATPQPPSARVG